MIVTSLKLNGAFVAGFSDPVYAEAFVNIQQFDIVLGERHGVAPTPRMLTTACQTSSSSIKPLRPYKTSRSSLLLWVT